jgi:hypothetical protein
MAQGGLSLPQQIALDLFVPPLGTLVWLLMARGWATIVQGGAVTETTRRRQRTQLWIVLVAAYVLMFGITIYGQLQT